MSDYWKETMDEILSQNGVAVRPSTVEKIAEQVEGAASVSMDYSSPVSGKSVEYTYDEITCPSCGGESWRMSKPGCSMCKGDQTIKIAREISND